MKRDWRAFREKVESEQNRCRVCGGSPAEAAHIVPRSQVSAGPGEDPRNCLPLCRRHHTQFDQAGAHTGRTLDVLSVTTKDEQAYAVELKGIEWAYRRLVGGRLGSAPDPCDPRRGGGEAVSGDRSPAPW